MILPRDCCFPFSPIHVFPSEGGNIVLQSKKNMDSGCCLNKKKEDKER
jgi:hypothetical protein